MEFKEFDDSYVQTFVHRPDPLTYAVVGLTSETGELAGKFHKALREVEPKDIVNTPHRNKMIDEGGDVLWNLSKIARELNTDLETMARYNMLKLRLRCEHGKVEGDKIYERIISEGI